MKQTFSYAFTWLLWIAAIALTVSGVTPWLLWLLALLHLGELLAVGYRTGREYGVSAGKSILMCMLYGYNWWLPLRRQMRVETFTSADFAREA